MPDQDPQQEAARPARAARQTAPDPDMVDVRYHGPSDLFRYEGTEMERAGAPVRLPRAALDDLRARFPDHAWSEVPAGD